jgi:hypothetical protein
MEANPRPRLLPPPNMLIVIYQEGLRVEGTVAGTEDVCKFCCVNSTKNRHFTPFYATGL